MGRDRSRAPDARGSDRNGPDVVPVHDTARRRDFIIIALLTLLAAGLRLWGVGWGLPNAEHMCSYHPDEGVNLVNGVLDRGVLRPHLDIGFYNYGSFYFLLWQAAGAVNSVYGFVGLPPASGPDARLAESLASLTLVGRLLSVALGAATVWTLCWMVRGVWGTYSAVAAGMMQTVAPLAVVHSRFATVDATATFLVTLALLVSLRLLQTKTVRMALAAGGLCGLAAATRYNAGIVVLSALAASFLSGADDRRLGWRNGLRLAAMVGIGCLAGFLIGCPGVLLNWERFSADLAFEARKSAEGMGLLFEQTGNGWVYHWVSSLRYGLGWPLLVLVTISALVACRRCKPAGLVLLAFAVPYYGMMGAARVRFMRYMLPLLPVLFAWAGAAVTAVRGPSRGQGSTVVRMAVSLFALVAVVWAAMVSAAFSLHMAGPDARDLTLTHLRRSLPNGSSVAFATTPWYWSPPILPEFTAPVAGSVRRRIILDSTAPYVLRLPAEGREWDLSVLWGPGPDAVVVSDLEAQDALRVGHPAAREFMRELTGRFDAVAIGRRPSVLGWQVVGDGHLPVDLLYVCPILKVYRPRGEANDHP